ncbi:MAG: gephyrin-like molybdotransferase Glp [Sulfurifustis sp.]
MVVFMIPLEQAQTALWQAIRPASDTERVRLEAAGGRYCAEVLRARVDHPLFDNSSMDGYAVNIAEARAHDYVLPVAGASSCGDAPKALTAGSAMRIYTGAPLPGGADVVVIQEDVEAREGRARVPRELRAGQNVRYRGEDFRAGAELYRAGHRFVAADLALLATAGFDTVPVYRAPRVLLIATGNELVSPGGTLAPGQIYQSNSVALTVALRAAGADVSDAGVVRDEPERLRDVLARGGEYDFVITTGGASVGDHDLVRQVFAEVGELRMWKVRIKPGKPIAFGHIGARTHFFALPGNPVSSLVTFKLFVEPALAVWNHGEPLFWRLHATAVNAFEREPGRTEFLRARLRVEGGRLLAEALAGQGSHMVGPLRHTNGFIRVEAESKGFAAGDIVEVLPLGF